MTAATVNTRNQHKKKNKDAEANQHLHYSFLVFCVHEPLCDNVHIIGTLSPLVVGSSNGRAALTKSSIVRKRHHRRDFDVIYGSPRKRAIFLGPSVHPRIKLEALVEYNGEPKAEGCNINLTENAPTFFL